MVYILLHTYAWKGDSCYPGHKRIAAQLGFKTTNTVRKYLNELKDNLLVDWDGKSELNTSVYEILEIPGVLLDDSKLSLKIINERIERLQQKQEKGLGSYARLDVQKRWEEQRGGLKNKPNPGLKNKPVSNTHESNTHSENFLETNHEGSNFTTFIPVGSSGGEAVTGSVKEARTSKRLLKYEPLTDIQVYELAKQFSVHPADVREVSKSAIAEFEVGKIIKPVGTFETTQHFLGFRTGLNPGDPRSLEVLGSDFQYMIEDAHPLNKALKKKHALALKAKSLKDSKKTAVGFRLMLENGPIEPGKLPQFLASYNYEEHLEVVNQRISEINLEGKHLFSQYKMFEAQVEEMKKLYPERLAGLLA